LGIDPRDTVPAWLRPGEWVIRPEAVRHYGSNLFAALNGRKVARNELKGLQNSAAAPRVPRLSFATGGPVASSPASSVTHTGPAAVFQFHDEQTLDRALAAGPNSMVRFTRTNKAAMRAALGMVPRG
jgi:hypothetical protein